MNWQIGCKNCDLVFKVWDPELPTEGHAVVTLRCPYCSAAKEYTTEDFIKKKRPPPRNSTR